MKRFIHYITILIITLGVISCEKANPRTLKSWIDASDTLVQNRIIHEQARIDSLCQSKTDSLYKVAYDSIYAKRWAEMKILLDSINAQ